MNLFEKIDILYPVIMRLNQQGSLAEKGQHCRYFQLIFVDTVYN